MSTFAARAAAFRQKLQPIQLGRAEQDREARLAALPPRQRYRQTLENLIRTAKHWPRTPDRNLHRDVPPCGWLLPILFQCDDSLWGRWDYWTRTRLNGALLDDEPIPEIEFSEQMTPARKMLEASLNAVSCHGQWVSWGHWKYIEYFFDYLLYGFGHLKEMPPEPEDGAFSRLYQVFCLEAMLVWPRDYFGDLLAEQHHGPHQGFYPTPHHVCEMMVRMQFHGSGGEGGKDARDKRALSVCDPCVGTGRMLLHASNHSLNLHGQDINLTCVKATLCNLYLYAPWGAKPLPFLTR